MTRNNEDVVVAEAETTVLIVDDEKLMRDVLTRWLTSEGWRCVAVANAESATQALQQQHVDLVLSDINMPGVSGLQLLDQTVADDPDLAVLMLTGCGETSSAIRALTHGACGYLLKPVQREELTVQVRRAVERTQLRRERRRHTAELEQRVFEQTREIRVAHEETIHRLVTAGANPLPDLISQQRLP